MAGTFQRYGESWKAEADELTVELQAIAMGGRWKGRRGQECGLGLFEHMMNARKLLWPGRYRHRWTDLIYQSIIKNIVTILMGPGSSGKTSHAAEFVLIDYWARPHDTLVLLTTTTVDKLDMAIFGEVKMLFEEGRNRYEWLAGNIIESKRAISTDDLANGEVRDIRKGFVGRACFVGKQYVGLGTYAGIKQKRIRFIADELQFCFVGGTLVDTPSGAVPIERIKPGDIVLSAIGRSRVLRTISRYADRLARVTTKDGRELVCTPSHRFFTQKGWVEAFNLGAEHYMLSPYEALQILRNDIHPSSIAASVRCVPGQANEELRLVLRAIYGAQAMQHEPLLRDELLREVETGAAGYSGQDLHAGASGQSRRHQKEMAGVGGGCSVAVQALAGNEEAESHARPGFLSESCSWHSGFWMQAPSAGRQWNRSHQGRVAAHANVSRGDVELWRDHRPEARQRIPAMLQVGFGVSLGEAGNRSGRRIAQQPDAPSSGPEEGPISSGAWVEGVTLLEPGDTGFPQASGDSRRSRVYNLEVEGHPSYGVNGLLAHNCQSTFFDCLPNMFQSADLDKDGDPDVKIIGSGNPKHDPYDQLSMAAEPVMGWASVGDVTKTTTWPTKFHRGECVNLIGLDSPNMDAPEGERPPFPRLISRNSIKMVEKRWGKNSMQYYSQCVGKMMMNMAGNRVITQELCQQHHAFEKAVWVDDKITRIGFLDPAWGGAGSDRCVWGWLEFGNDLDGREIIRFGEYIVVPFAAKSSILPDDQIGIFVKQQAKQNGIDPADIFYDSTGRGTIGAAFARVFGAVVPVPVAFGDHTTARPVRHDLFVTEPNGNRRLKRCDEEYSKFVTELWFSVRNVIECDQMRELPEEVAREGYMREYMLTKGNKIEVEPKEDTLLRMGCSPDLFDALVVGVEGARQRGFSIGRLGADVTEGKNAEEWFEKEAREYEEVMAKKMLKR